MMDPNLNPSELFRMQLEKRLDERRNDLRQLKAQNRNSLIKLIIKIVLAILLSVLLEYISKNENMVISFSAVIYLIWGVEIILLVISVLDLLRFLGNQGFPLLARIFNRGVQYSNSFLQREARHDIIRLQRKLNELD